MSARNRRNRRFPHHRLEAYWLALRVAKQAKGLADQVPRGYRTYADHLVRSAGACVMLIAEGANRRAAGQKRQRFDEAMGECGESAGAAELLQCLGLVQHNDAEQYLDISDELMATVTGLHKRFA